MGVDQLFVDPVTTAFGKLFDIEFPSCDHDLMNCAIEVVTVNIYIREIVVGADLLDLA